MKRLSFIAIVIAALSFAAAAQPRPIAESSKPKAAAAPESFAVKYEGGMVGYSNKVEGTLKFDDAKERLIFSDSTNKRIFVIPYDTMLVIYPQSRSVTSTTGNVVKNIPLPGAVLGGFIKEKRRYLIIQIDDPDIDIRGVVNFKLESKELLDSVIQTLAEKAGLQERGDAYYRPRTKTQFDQVN